MRTTSPIPMEDTRTISDADSTPSTSYSELGPNCYQSSRIRTISDTDSTPSTSHSYLDYQSDYGSQSAPEYYSIDISNIEMHHIPKVGWNSLDDRFWLQVIADGKVKETSVAGRGSLCWPEKFTFNVRKSSKLSFRLYARRYVHEHKFLAEATKCVDTLVASPDHLVFSGWSNPKGNVDLKRTTLICETTKRILSPEEAVAEEAATEAETATNQRLRLRVSNIVVHHLPRVKLISLDDHFFVQIEVDGKVACITDVQRGHSLRWKNEYLCDYRKDSRIELKVFAHRHVHKDHLVCAISDDVESLLQDFSIRRQFSGLNQSEKDIPASIEFQIASSTSTATNSLQLPDDIFSAPDGGGVADAFMIAPTTISVEISDIRLVHLPKLGMVAFNDQFFVQLGVESETQSTSQKTQQNGSISWDDKYVFRVPETALLSLRVYARRPNDEYIGMIHDQIGAFLQGSGYNDGQLIVFDKQSKKNLETRLSFQIKLSSSSYGHSRGSICSLSSRPLDRGLQQHAGNSSVVLSSSSYGNSRGSVRSLSTQSSNHGPQQHASDAISALSSSSYGHSGGSARSLSTKSSVHSPQHHAGNAIVATGAMTTPLNGVVQLVQSGTQSLSVQAGQTLFGDTVNAFEPLLSRIDTFVKMGSIFASAHPYTKMAFMVLTAGYEVIRRQHARDESIRQLALTMCDSYSLVSDATDLCRFQGQQETITLLARQTIECAYFIRDYALYKSGSKHAISNVFSSIDTTILGYETAFGNIKAALEQKVVINTQLVVCHIHDALKDLAARVDLNQLPYATGASYHAQRSYENMSVEEDLLTEISDWVNDQSGPAIYLLIGPHGSEASAAAHAVARRFDDISRLGSSYCLDRTHQTHQRPNNLFSTIARDLADHDPEFMTCLGGIVKRRAVGCSPHIPTQFNFILAPAQQLTSFGPVLIVIDALDACGDAHSRADVLSVLKEKAQNLPPSFKFLITCLPATDVATTLRDSAHVLSKELEAVATKQICDQGFIAGRINPRLSTPPIQTAFPQPDYFALAKSSSSVANMSCSSLSSIGPSIFDEGLRTFNSPDSDISSPASSITSCTDAGSPKRFLVKRIETTEESYSLDPDGQPRLVSRRSLRKTFKQHSTSTPRYPSMLNESNSAHSFTSEPTTITEDTFSAIPRVGSPAMQDKQRTQDIIEVETTASQPMALLSF